MPEEIVIQRAKPEEIDEPKVKPEGAVSYKKQLRLFPKRKLPPGKGGSKFLNQHEAIWFFRIRFYNARALCKNVLILVSEHLVFHLGS